MLDPNHSAALEPKLSPTGNPNMFNTEADLFRPDEKRFRSLHSLEVWEAEVGSGDIIFIPNGVSALTLPYNLNCGITSTLDYTAINAGWPHQVRNLDTTIAVSYNYIDDVTQSAHEQYLMNAAKYASGTDALVERNLNLMQATSMSLAIETRLI